MDYEVAEEQSQVGSLDTSNAGHRLEYFDPQLQCNFLGYVNECRMTEHLTDFKVIVKEEIFHTHRAVLASLSSYFDSVLKFGGTDRNELCLDWMEPSIFSDILHYAYTGSISLSPNNLQDILMAADYFNITTIKKEGQKMMVSNLDVNNIFHALHFATIYSLDILRQGCVEYFMKRMVDIVETMEYPRMDESFLTEVFSSDNLVVEDRAGKIMNSVDREKLVLRAVLRYLSFKFSERLTKYESLIATARLPYLSRQDVNAVFEEFPSLKRKKLIKKYVVLSNKINRLRKKNAPDTGILDMPLAWRRGRKLAAYHVTVDHLDRRVGYPIPRGCPNNADVLDSELEIKSITMYAKPPEMDAPRSIGGIVVKYRKTSEIQEEERCVLGVVPDGWLEVKVELAQGEHITCVTEYFAELGTESLVFNTDQGVTHSPLGRGGGLRRISAPKRGSYLYSLHCDSYHTFGHPSIHNFALRWICPE